MRRVSFRLFIATAVPLRNAIKGVACVQTSVLLRNAIVYKKLCTFTYLTLTTSNIRNLAEADKVFMDGTFQTCPRLFYQIFTIHAFKNGKQFPFAYCLLPGKSRAVYLGAFELIKQKAEDLGFVMSPAEVLTDFELAIIQAIELAFLQQK